MPGHYKNLLTGIVKDDIEPKLEPSLFFKGRSMCHTARLPSQSRYLGYLTDTDKVGKQAPYGQETYEVGIEKKVAEKVVAEVVVAEKVLVV